MEYNTQRHTRPASAPRKPLPAGAWDTHSHVFGPFDRYPLLAERRYNPPLAPAEDYLAMLDSVGFAHGVLVHSSANGYDNSGTADAVAGAQGRLFGTAVVQPGVSDKELEALHAQGIRAIRFTATGARAASFQGSADLEDLAALAPRMKALGWHAQIWGTCATMVEQQKALGCYGFPISFDHMGYFEIAKGAQDPVFRDFLAMLADGDFWVKNSVVRVCRNPPTYAEARPFHDALMQAIPDRVIFGSDWPYISLDAAPPDVGRLVDLFDEWTSDEALRQKVFVTNPARLYGI